MKDSGMKSRSTKIHQVREALTPTETAGLNVLSLIAVS